MHTAVRATGVSQDNTQTQAGRSPVPAGCTPIPPLPLPPAATGRSCSRLASAWRWVAVLRPPVCEDSLQHSAARGWLAFQHGGSNRVGGPCGRLRDAWPRWGRLITGAGAARAWEAGS